MPSLILEGGTFRPIFSCGVMDTLLDEDIMFPYCIGVSAGISDGVSYLSRQKGRNLEIGLKYRNDKRYLGIGNYRTDKSLFGLDFVFGEIPKKLVPFDWETYRKYDGKVRVGVTNAITGRPEYKDGKEMDEAFTMLRATCALPVFFPAIELDGQPYFDGGISDPIPVKKAIADGNEKHLIVLTRPEGYRKELSKKSRFAAGRLHKKYPEVSKLLLKRHESYNQTVRFCEELEQQGKAVIIRPITPIDSFEKNVNLLEDAYKEGCRLAKERMEEIRALFE